MALVNYEVVYRLKVSTNPSREVTVEKKTDGTFQVKDESRRINQKKIQTKNDIIYSLEAAKAYAHYLEYINSGYGSKQPDGVTLKNKLDSFKTFIEKNNIENNEPESLDFDFGEEIDFTNLDELEDEDFLFISENFKIIHVDPKSWPLLESERIAEDYNGRLPTIGEMNFLNNLSKTDPKEFRKIGLKKNGTYWIEPAKRKPEDSYRQRGEVLVYYFDESDCYKRDEKSYHGICVIIDNK